MVTTVKTGLSDRSHRKPGLLKWVAAVPPGVVWMPMHYAEARANELTHDVGDPEIGTPEYKVTAVRLEKLAG